MPGQDDMNNAMKHFLSAERYAVVGRVMTDPKRWDYKVLKWYQQRKLPVVPVRPGEASEGHMEVEGLNMLSDVKSIPNLSQTSISIIINPLQSLDILKSLYPIPARPAGQEPHSVWFQPGADDETIWKYVQERGIERRVVGRGKCVLRDGDAVREGMQSRL